MSVSCFIKLVAAALAASLLGFFAIGMIDTGAIPAASLFASGITLGTIFGGLLVALYPGSESADVGEEADGSGNLYVGNLPFNAGKDDIGNIFKPYGEVKDIRMVKDRRSKRFKGYAFVEMDANGAAAAIKHLDGTDYAGRTLRVNEAKRKEES